MVAGLVGMALMTVGMFAGLVQDILVLWGWLQGLCKTCMYCGDGINDFGEFP